MKFQENIYRQIVRWFEGLELSVVHPRHLQAGGGGEGRVRQEVLGRAGRRS